jgi:arsenate reductase (thioredoxin)
VSGRPPSIEKVLFACAHDAGRAQMAAAFFNLLADPGRATAFSAGVEPARAVHPEVVAAMKEVGVDLSAARPTLLTAEMMRGASLVVTMGCGEECPYVLGLRMEDWPMGDPGGQPLERVREMRDDVGLMVAQLVSTRRWVRGLPDPPPRKVGDLRRRAFGRRRPRRPMASG